MGLPRFKDNRHYAKVRALAGNMWDTYSWDGDMYASKYFGSSDSSEPLEPAEMVYPFLLQTKIPLVWDHTAESCPHKARRASLASLSPGELEREYTPVPLTAKISQHPLSGIWIGF